MISFEPYERKAQYYETDQMGIIHHSNYIRWFEEARVDFMEKMGMGYDVMEQNGIISPVLAMCCEYKSMVRFGDIVLIRPLIKQYNGIKMVISYTVIDKNTGDLRCVGESKHCFLNQEGRPISLKRTNKEFDDKFKGLLADNSEE